MKLEIPMKSDSDNETQSSKSGYSENKAYSFNLGTEINVMQLINELEEVMPKKDDLKEENVVLIEKEIESQSE